MPYVSSIVEETTAATHEVESDNVMKDRAAMHATTTVPYEFSGV